MMNSNEKVRGCRGGRRMFWKIPVFVIGFAAIKAGITMVLWNALIPDLFHGPQVDYLQSLGLVVLAKILVGGGFHRGGGHFGGWGRHNRDFHFSREDREKLREEFRKRRDEHRGFPGPSGQKPE